MPSRTHRLTTTFPPQERAVACLERLCTWRGGPQLLARRATGNSPNVAVEDVPHSKPAQDPPLDPGPTVAGAKGRRNGATVLETQNLPSLAAAQLAATCSTPLGLTAHAGALVARRQDPGLRPGDTHHEMRHRSGTRLPRSWRLESSVDHSGAHHEIPDTDLSFVSPGPTSMTQRR